jgi:hypothetical protein
METQPMVERPSIFSKIKIKIDKILVVRLEELFCVGNEMGCSFFHGLWTWPLEASH